MKQARYDTANAMAGLDPMPAYINDPIASLYGTHCIFLISSGDSGQSLTDRLSPGFIGIESSLASYRLKQSTSYLLDVRALAKGDCALASVPGDFQAKQPI